MKITEKQLGELHLQIDINLTEEDYAPVRKKKLADYRRNADIKGFRKGMVPQSLAERLFGERAMIDAVNTILPEALEGYIKEKSYKTIGEPLASDATPRFDFQTDKEFTFCFEIGLRPEISFELSEADDKVVSYKITKTKAAIKEREDQILSQYGELVAAPEAGENDFITVDFTAGEEKVEDTYVALRSVAPAAKDQFIGVKVGDSFDVKVAEAFPNESDRAAMLKVQKENLAEVPEVWTVTVKKVETFGPAPRTVETFDKIFGKDVVKTEEEFTDKVTEILANDYETRCQGVLNDDIRDYLVDKAEVKVPEDYLRKLIRQSDDKITDEDLEKDLPKYIESFKWDLVRDYLFTKYEIKVTREEYEASAKGYASYQFAMYGMNNVPEEQLASYAQTILADEKMSYRIQEAVRDDKAITEVKKHISLVSKNISLEKFNELSAQ